MDVKKIFKLGKWVTRTAKGQKKKNSKSTSRCFFGGKNGYNAYFHLPFGFVFTGVWLQVQKKNSISSLQSTSIGTSPRLADQAPGTLGFSGQEP